MRNRFLALFCLCFISVSFAQLELTPNPACANNAPYCRQSISVIPYSSITPGIMGVNNGILYAQTTVGAGVACPNSNVAANNSPATFCFYSTSTFAPENWVYLGQFASPDSQGVIELVFGSGSCASYKYIYASGKHLLRATSAANDWHFTDIISNINFPGQGIPPNIPPDTGARPGSFAIGNNSSGGTRLVYVNYNDHSYNPQCQSDTTKVCPPGGLVWYSDYCGDTWSSQVFRLGGREVHAVNVDPANPSNVYAAVDAEDCDKPNTICFGVGVDPLGLWKSTDGGATFSKVSGSNLLPIDFVFPSSSSKLFLEPDGGSGDAGPLLSWDKVNGGNIATAAQWPPVSSGEPPWKTGFSGSIKATSEGNIFLVSHDNPGTGDGVTNRTGAWYFAPPAYNTAILLEDFQPPIKSITVSGGTATVITYDPHTIQLDSHTLQPTDTLAIKGVSPSGFNTTINPGGYTVTGPYSFTYSCSGCPASGTGGYVSKYPGFYPRTVEITGPQTSYLYSTTSRIVKPQFAQPSRQILSTVDIGSGNSETFFIGTDQHVHMLLNSNGAWGNHDVNSYAGAPTTTIPAAGSELASLNLGNGNSETFFIGTDQHVHMLLNWNGAWGNHDINSYAGAPTNTIPANGSTLSVLDLGGGNSAIFFIGTDQHVHMLLYWNGAWGNHDISSYAGAPTSTMPVVGSSLSSLSLGNGNLEVFFVGIDEHVHMLLSLNGAWGNHDINAYASTPTNVIPAFWTQLSTLDLGGGNSATFFIGGDLHIHRLLNVNGTWENDDINSLAGAPTNVLPMTASSLASFNLGSGNSATFFIGTDQHAHMLLNSNGAWGNHDVNSYAGAPTDVDPAVRSPYTRIDYGSGNSGTFFIGTDQHVHMLLNWSGAWGNHDINSYAGAPTNVNPALP